MTMEQKNKAIIHLNNICYLSQIWQKFPAIITEDQILE